MKSKEINYFSARFEMLDDISGNTHFSIFLQVFHTRN